MNSLTKGSGIALSMLVAATASALLLVPGHPRAGSWRGPGRPGGVMVATAAATSPAGAPGPGGRPQAASTPAPGRPAAGSRLVCRAAGAPGGRVLAGPRRRGEAGPRRRGSRPAQDRPGSCRPRWTRRHQETPERLPLYHGIRPDLP
ncbi:MAG TPA: hypothetical protein VIF35_14220 [Streptosporangiaceae bacterium]